LASCYIPLPVDTTYQHLSGTRGPLDFVEIPSHLFEFFASDVRCLSLWARHYKTGERAPDSLILEALKYKRNFESIEVGTQILYSLVDQHIFGSRFGDVSGLSDAEIYTRVVTSALQLQREHMNIPLATNLEQDVLEESLGIQMDQKDDQGGIGNCYPSLYLPSHSHFVTYGGAYYAYLFAKMAAADIWQKHFSANPLSRQAGNVLYHSLLKHGVSKSPQIMLRELCDGDLDPRSYFDSVTGVNML
jgi:mitochondrial intermediate peptidase